MRVVRRLDQEEILHDDDVHIRQRARHVTRVGVGLQNVLALDV